MALMGFGSAFGGDVMPPQDWAADFLRRNPGDEHRLGSAYRSEIKSPPPPPPPWGVSSGGGGGINPGGMYSGGGIADPNQWRLFMPPGSSMGGPPQPGLFGDYLNQFHRMNPSPGGGGVGGAPMGGASPWAQQIQPSYGGLLQHGGGLMPLSAMFNPSIPPPWGASGSRLQF